MNTTYDYADQTRLTSLDIFMYIQPLYLLGQFDIMNLLARFEWRQVGSSKELLLDLID